MDQFDGDWSRLVTCCEGSALRLVDLVVHSISSYDDKCEFEGRQVYFRKRAQILVADIWACFEGKGFGAFRDIDSVTMFADYRVPQSLVYFGAIKYSEALTEKLRANPFLPKGSREECEIRAASIWSVELARRRALDIMAQEKDVTETKGSGGTFNAIVIDFYLWDYAKASSAKMEHIPIHKTTTYFY